MALTLAALPLQGALAAIMPLCAQAGQALHLSTADEPSIHAAPTPCSQHDASNGSLAQQTGEDQESFNLPCDGAVCHISGGGLPSATAPLSLFGGFSFITSFNSRFTSSILPQPHRPPLA
ncbi:MAG TPA: hypothetical protein VFI43_04085 [Nitrosospira sp.]|nr:hypothetical protein [Nitrosospira sp.]